jgi:hypothetical protein
LLALDSAKFLRAHLVNFRLIFVCSHDEDGRYERSCHMLP